MTLTSDANDLLAWSYDRVGDNRLRHLNKEDAAADLGWGKRRVEEAVSWMHNKGWVEDPMGPRYWLTFAGIDAAEARASEGPARRAERWSYLKAVYDMAGGRPSVCVSTWDAGEAIGQDHDRIERVADYLDDKEWLQFRGEDLVELTEVGIELVEGAQSQALDDILPHLEQDPERYGRVIEEIRPDIAAWEARSRSPQPEAELRGCTKNGRLCYNGECQ